jgi:uncharacterized surface protein with fasciclin (FAS1) repeats
MKKQIITTAIFVTACLLFFNSCKKKENSNNTDSVTLTAIRNDPSLRIFTIIEGISGDDALFTNGYVYAIPNDSAFTNTGMSIIVAASLSKPVCDSIVRYYTLPYGLNFSNTANTEMAFMTSLPGEDIFADSTSSAIYFNGVAAVSTTAVAAGTSSIYKLTKVLNVPVSSVSQIAAADPSLSLFIEAYNRTNLGGNFTGISYTLFMPTNAAFISAGYPDIGSIDAADINTLTQILLYHTVANTLFTNDIMLQTSIPTLQGGTIAVNTSGGNLQLVGNSDPSVPAGIVSAGVFANNVWAYKINQLLLP